MEVTTMNDRLYTGVYFLNSDDFNHWYNTINKELIGLYKRFLFSKCKDYKDIWYSDYLIWELRQ